ncbi:MAG TPA: Gfo/Idh/MocA family oxidoreductase [Candidatus Saccharimonadales bacterium]|nr:Gfo/Idh/MocA family oxidoreductase [Candidatus Saccharimonadales bacterium]
MRAAIIGTGYIAGVHVRNISQHPDIEIVGCVDVTPGQAAKAAETWGGNAYESVDDLLAHEQMDIAWLCVPPFVHGDIELKLIEAGVPMYIEKPISLDMSVAEKIARALQDSKVLATVGYHWRSIAVLAEVRKLLQENPPHLVEAAYLGNTPGTPWWRRKEKSGGQVVEQATHLYDIARMLLGEATVLHAADTFRPLPDYEGLDVATATSATLAFGSGTLAHFSTTCVLKSTPQVSISFYSPGRKIMLTRKEYGGANDTELIVETEAFRSVRTLHDTAIATTDYAFIEAVKSGDPAKLPCGYDDALKTHRLCLQVTELAERNRI